MPEPYIDPELRPFLPADEVRRWDLDAIRSWAEENLKPTAFPGATLTEHEALGVPLRVWQPRETPSRYILAIHGGGFTAGKAEYDDERNGEMALEFDAVVVSPDYRLAPEHPFPAGADDCLTALAWTCAQADSQPVYLYGDSAGGGLAETTLAMHIDASGPNLAGLIMVEPDLDPRMSTGSMATYAHGPVWNREKAEGSWADYLAGTDPGALPRLNDRAESCPPVLTFVNPVDPLRDEGIAFAVGLVDAGVRVELHMPQGTYHSALSIRGTRVWENTKDLIGRFIDGCESARR